MKIGTTILALPDQHESGYTDTCQYDLIETTRKHLLSDISLLDNCLSMLSVVDYSSISPYMSIENKYDECVMLLTEAIVMAKSVGLNSISFGSPTMRENVKNSYTACHFFTDVITKLKSIDLFKKSDNFTVYIEPLPHKFKFLSSYIEIVDLCDILNNIPHSGLTFKPLFDTGWYLKTYDEDDRLTKKEFFKLVAKTTDRIHFAYSDTETKFDKFNPDTLRLLSIIREICENNPNMTIIYEHINFDENESHKDFFAEMKQLSLEVDK